MLLMVSRLILAVLAVVVVLILAVIPAAQRRGPALAVRATLVVLGRPIMVLTKLAAVAVALAQAVKMATLIRLRVMRARAALVHKRLIAFTMLVVVAAVV